MTEYFLEFKNYFLITFDQVSLGLSLFEFLIIIFSFLIALFIRTLFAKFFIARIKKIVYRTGNKIDDDLFDSLAPPLKILPIVLVLILSGFLTTQDSQLDIFMGKINQTLITIFIFWFLHQLLMPLSHAFQKLENILSKALLNWFTRSLGYLFIFLGIVAVLETWGIKIGPVIAGLGLFGVAVALGAQDLFKNLISGIMIIFEKRFELNDIIEVPGHAIGTVEHIGFRSTLIRQFDSTPISIPNYVFSDSSIINFSDRKFRRINWISGLTYDTSVKQLKEICQSIEKYILSNENFINNINYKLNVRVDKFNDSSIDILIIAFANTNEWDEFLKIKEDLVFNIKNIVEVNQSSFAFPSQSIYIEKNQ